MAYQVSTRHHRGAWRWWWWILALTITTISVCRASVGVWMDDGNGRTVLADDLDSEQAAELARDILDVLDLPAPPTTRSRHHHHHHRPIHSHASAPTWLKGIYEVLDEHGHATAGQMDAAHRETVTAADTIITFVSRDPPNGRPQHGANRRLYFDVSDVPLDHSLLGAEIRVHRQPDHQQPILLHVYLVTNEEGNESEVSRVVLQEPGWTSVNITTSVFSWSIFPHTNFGLRLAVTSPDKKHERRFHEVGLSGSHDGEDVRPFMVGYFALPESVNKRKRVRTTRSVNPPTRTSRPRSYREVTDCTIGCDTWCRLKHLHVSFRDLGWENWVIAPEGYDANYCEGRCEFPLHARMNASNHALVQTLVKLVMLMDGVSDDGERPPNACCVPIDLATIPVLYYSHENNIVLKKYPKMIVKSCGCQ